MESSVFYNADDKPRRFCSQIINNVVLRREGLRFCTVGAKNHFWIKADNSVEGYVENYITLKKNTISAICNGNESFINENFSVCKTCPNWRERDMSSLHNFRIKLFVLDIYPAPCQAKCVYCRVHSNYELNNFQKCYENPQDTIRALEFIRHLEHLDMCNTDTTWIQVSSGELSIHPYKNLFFEYLGNYNLKIYTNAFKFDELIARHLRNNPQSLVNVSLDSGTPETFEKVKGFNLYPEVVGNIESYSELSRMELKYIMLPDLNCTEGDFEGFVLLCNKVKPKSVIITSNHHKKITNQDVLYDDMIKLYNMLINNGHRVIAQAL